MTGITLTYARSISEFGAVIILVYYPMTAPVKIYELFLRFGLEQSASAAVLLLIVSLSLFVLLRTLAQRGGGPWENR
jgi:molybdate/tungstate transport system permease protein